MRRPDALSSVAVLFLLACTPGPEGAPGQAPRTSSPGSASPATPDPARPPVAAPEPVWSTRCGGELQALPAIPGGCPILGGVGLAGGGALVTARCADAPTTAFLLDGATGTWTRVADMRHPRVSPHWVALADGRALVLGGTATPVPAEWFDPATRTWTETGTPPDIVTAAAPLREGDVLVTGWRFQSVWRFHLTTGSWTHVERGAYAEVFGRIADDGARIRAELLHHAGGSPPFLREPEYAVMIAPDTCLDTSDGFAVLRRLQLPELPGRLPELQRASPAHSRTGGAVVRLRGGGVLAVGGSAARPRELAGTPERTVEVYDSAQDRWQPAVTLPFEVTAPAPALALADGRALIGSSDGSAAALFVAAKAEACTAPAAPSPWRRTAPMAHARVRAGALLLPDGRVLIAGGASPDEKHLLTSTELFDPKTETWTQGDDLPLAGGEWLASLVMLRGGDVLAVTNKASLRFEPRTRTWSARTALPVEAFGTAAVLDDGTVVVAAARPHDGLLERHPGTGAWRHVSIPGVPLKSLVANGARRLVAFGNPDTLASDPDFPTAWPVALERTADGWRMERALRDVPFSRSPAAIRLRDGILAVGGHYGPHQDAFLLDTRRKAVAVPTVEPRGFRPAVAELTTGEVLVLGDADGSDAFMHHVASTGAELYSPWTGTFRATPAPYFDRFSGAVLVALPDGRALLAGGVGWGAADKVELYAP